MKNWRWFVLKMAGFPEGLEEFRMNQVQKLIVFLLCKTVPETNCFWNYNPWRKSKDEFNKVDLSKIPELNV